MKKLWLIPYYIFVCLAFCIIPLIEISCFIITRKFDIKMTYDSWKDHYESGSPWGPLDRGRNF